MTDDTWDDFVALFESRGGPDYCWCMAWRATPAERESKSKRRAGMRRRVREGVPVGLLGYVDDEPVAWCSVAPRDTYRPLGGPEEDEDEKVWSITCFFVTRDLRRNGVMAALIESAAEHARGNGATVLEAYPVDPDSPSYRFMGFVSVFEKAGFGEVGSAGTRRHVMRRDLT